MNPGIYLHIPFCQSRCSYCHFTTRPWDPEAAERYRAALEHEILRYQPGPEIPGPAETIYFGGGTPSLVPSSHLRSLLDAIQKTFGISEMAEITLEANPGTVTPASAADYRRLGINRVSLGAQSFDDTELRALGRVHTSQDVRDSVRILRDAGLTNVSLDLMLGLPDQTEGAWRHSLNELAALRPEHVSIYMLDLDVASPLQHAISGGTCAVPDDDLIADLYLETVAYLARTGYAQYEISNFCLPSSISRHNLKYWLRKPVIGFGVSSHSFDGTARFANTEVMATYLSSLEAGESVVVWRRPDDDATALGESLFLGLRLNHGIDCGALRSKFGSVEYERVKPAIDRAIASGVAEMLDDRLRLTARGMLLSNEVFSEFV